MANKKFFIGREKEQKLLNDYLRSDQSEFIAIYGRRRVGKTYLIQQVIGDDYAFYVTGMNKVSMRMQLSNFMEGIRRKGGKGAAVKSWLEAFFALEGYLESLRSNFISGLEHFWNSWASWRSDIKLIVCGSATSWIINNLIKNRGGLHNRVTHKIPLKPFSLGECRSYFSALGFRYSTKQIAECYMILGGVPYYLSKMEKSESVAQNVDRLLFAEDGELHDEFQSLYNSLYKNASNHIKVVTALAGKGLTRQELIAKTRIADNGKFSTLLEELDSCGFIRCYEPFSANLNRKGSDERQSPDTLYQLVDPFTLFYFQVMRKASAHDASYWTNNQNSTSYNTWCGLSFEMLCLNHIEQIKQALGIAGVAANIFSWFGKGDSRRAQIDMLIDRADRTINVCEMKYYNKPYALTANDEEEIERKVSTLLEATGTDKSVIVTMITTKGIEKNEYSSCIQKELTLDDLFG